MTDSGGLAWAVSGNLGGMAGVKESVEEKKKY
jgi:hypothetical protein